MPRMQATLLGAREVGFTVLSMSMSLIAVFLPILLMGGIVGRYFNEFAHGAVGRRSLISLVVSLTTTPMMCAFSTCTSRTRNQGLAAARCPSASSTAALRFYDRTLAWALRQSAARSCSILLDHDRAQLLSLLSSCPRASFPPRTPAQVVRRHPRRPDHLVPAHGAEVRDLHEHHQRGSGGAEP